MAVVYDIEQENWRIIVLTNNEIYASDKIPTITETIRLNRLRRFGHLQRMEENFHRPMKMEQTECCETSAYKIQTPGGESPRRKHTTFRTRRKFEIKELYL